MNLPNILLSEEAPFKALPSKLALQDIKIILSYLHRLTQ